MDEVTRNIQGNISWCMLFADDVVLVEESRAGVIRKLELWKDMLESKGFGLSRTKTEYMRCDFSATGHEEGDVSLDGQVVAMEETFRYQCGKEDEEHGGATKKERTSAERASGLSSPMARRAAAVGAPTRR